MAGQTPILYQRNVNQDLYTYALQSVYNSGWRVYDPDFALSRDADIFEKVKRDPVIAHAMDMRLHKIAGKQWYIAPGGKAPEDKQAANLVEEAFRDNLQNFTEARYELAQACLVARTYGYISGHRKACSLNSMVPQAWWVPRRIDDIDRRRFKFVPYWDPDPGSGTRRKLRVQLQLYSVERRQWELIKHPEWFVRHVYQDEEARLGHGRGLIEAIYFYHWIKTRILEEGIQWVERWAQGIVTAKIDGLRQASDVKSNTTIRNEWLDVIKKMRGRHALVYGKEDEFKVSDPPGTGARVVMDFLHYLDAGIQKLILGEVRASGGTPSGGGATGARAQAETEAEQSEILMQYDRTLLDEVITRDLIGLFWRQNRPQLAAVGLAMAKRPRFESVQEKKEDPEKAAGVITQILSAGLPLKRDEVYRKINFSPPEPGDDIVGGAQPAGPGGPPESGGGFDPEHERGPGGSFAKKGTGHTGKTKIDEGQGDRDSESFPEEPTGNAPKFHEREPRNQFVDVTPHIEIHPPQVTVYPPKVDVAPPNVEVHPPSVNVEAPNVNIDPPNVNVEAPNVNIEAPPAPDVHVEVEAPTVNVDAPVHVDAPKVEPIVMSTPKAEAVEREIEFEYKDGLVQKAKSKPKPKKE